MYPEFFGGQTSMYMDGTHKNATMVIGEWEHFQDLCL